MWITGLAAGTYDVYVYADGDNKVYDRAAAYTISGSGISTTTINLTDAANANFGSTFTRADNSNGNYVRFSIACCGRRIHARGGPDDAGRWDASRAGQRDPDRANVCPAATAAAAAGAIGVDFLGGSSIAMAATESGSGASESELEQRLRPVAHAPLALVDESGAATNATLTWSANGGWRSRSPTAPATRG